MAVSMLAQLPSRRNAAFESINMYLASTCYFVSGELSESFFVQIKTTIELLS